MSDSINEAQVAIAKLAAAEATLAMLNIEKDLAADDLLPAEVRRALNDLELEYGPSMIALSEEIEKLRHEARRLVLEAGETVAAGPYRFEYSAGKSGGWDGKALEKLADALRLAGSDRVADAILACRKPNGKPYVSIKEAKEE